MSLKLVAGVPIMAVAAYAVCLRIIGPEVASHAKLEQSCGDYVTRALPLIINSWSVDAWRERSSNELIASTNIRKLERQFKTNRKFLGEFKGMDIPTGYVVVDKFGDFEETVGYFSTRARYRVGSADITMKLVKRSGGWKLQKFNVRTDVSDPDL